MFGENNFGTFAGFQHPEISQTSDSALEAEDKEVKSPSPGTIFGASRCPDNNSIPAEDIKIATLSSNKHYTTTTKNQRGMEKEVGTRSTTMRAQ